VTATNALAYRGTVSKSFVVQGP